jgi:hypothetical protein
MKSREETEANMRLCSAAPDLLEIVVRLRDALLTLQEREIVASGKSDSASILIREADAAIAKVRGDE